MATKDEGESADGALSIANAALNDIVDTVRSYDLEMEKFFVVQRLVIRARWALRHLSDSINKE